MNWKYFLTSQYSLGNETIFIIFLLTGETVSAKLPQFFIRFLTQPGDIVLDIFAGSNTTGFVCEQEGRYWLAFEKNKEYLAASALRFKECSKEGIISLNSSLEANLSIKPLNLSMMRNSQIIP